MPSPASESNPSAANRRAARRQLLASMALAPLAGISAAGRAAAAEPAGAAPAGKLPPPALVPLAESDDFLRLKSLDLDSPQAKASRAPMPKGTIAGRQFGRLVSGSNLISMNMHARDLDYMTNLAKAYNTEERVFMTLKRCEEHGCDSVVLKDHNFKQFRLADYWTGFGGKMAWHADVITQDIRAFERRVEEHLELGAWSVYLWGGAADIWYHQGNQDYIVKAYEIMRKCGVPVGIGAHRLEPIQFCEREGLKPDYYIKTLHHDRYWSAHPVENRRFMEMFEPVSPDHGQYHDNMFCHEHRATVEFMQDVRVPWIAFKVLAAGAIPPEEGIQYAFDSGADFICLGMFDFQVNQDAALVQKCVEKARNRPRPWA
ncbi:MAG: hypothetical protein ACYC6Y_26060 [Thermoguttaceae bacterium]